MGRIGRGNLALAVVGALLAVVASYWGERDVLAPVRDEYSIADLLRQRDAVMREFTERLSPVLVILTTASVVLLWIGLSGVAKDKGRSKGWSAFALLSVIGLLVVLFLPAVPTPPQARPADRV